MRHDRHYVENLVVRDGEVVGKMVPLEALTPNPNQPRKSFQDLELLAESIKDVGILEPLLVQQQGDGYMIIAGERRFQAAKMAELSHVPCMIKNLNSAQILEMALIENLQRQDLHPLEESDALACLVAEHQYTHETLAKKMGKSRSSITESLSLANLTAKVRQEAFEAQISAKTMLVSIAKVKSEEEQLALIAKIKLGANREDIRSQQKSKKRPKPFQFRFRDPQKQFQLQLHFKKQEVTKTELIDSLRQILQVLENEVSDDLSS
jgi:ParB family chromosome partitioning protein